MFRRGRRRPRPAVRISLGDDDRDREFATLQHMLTDVNEVIEVLWLEVEDLRAQLARLRHVPDVPAMYARPPTQAVSDSADVVTLARHLDAASTAADGLWFESQWIRGQVASIVEHRG